MAMKTEPAVGALGTDLLLAQSGSPLRTADWLSSDFSNGLFDSTDDLDLPSALSGAPLPFHTAPLQFAPRVL